MKKIIFCLILIFTAYIVFGQANVPAIVVSTFSARGQAVTADDTESITELFIAELAKQGGVRVVDRTSLDRVVAEMRFQTSDWSNPQKTTQLGAALNAEFLIRGQINQLGQQIAVAITALDIKTLEVVSSSTATFTVDNIFSTASGGLFGQYYRNSSQTHINKMAQEIASPIKTKMTELAKQRQAELEEHARSRYLIGNWVFPNNNMKLTFNADNTFSLSNYETEIRETRPTNHGYNATFIAKAKGNIKGTYFRNGDTLEMVYTFTYVYSTTLFGEPIVKDENGSQEIRTTMKVKIDINNGGVLYLDEGFIRVNDRFVNPYRNTYYNEFIRIN